eukprot:1160918-Pelagomonas_calceolata.AAC.7
MHKCDCFYSLLGIKAGHQAYTILDWRYPMMDVRRMRVASLGIACCGNKCRRGEDKLVHEGAQGSVKKRRKASLTLQCNAWV